MRFVSARRRPGRGFVPGEMGSTEPPVVNPITVSDFYPVESEAPKVGEDGDFPQARGGLPGPKNMPRQGAEHDHCILKVA